MTPTDDRRRFILNSGAAAVAMTAAALTPNASAAGKTNDKYADPTNPMLPASNMELDLRGDLLASDRAGQTVVQWMGERATEPSDLVRNYSLRVLGDIAEFNPQYVIPTGPIIEALNYPRATDRSKSVFVAHLLTLNSQSARDEILKSGVPNVLRLLAASMPDRRRSCASCCRRSRSMRRAGARRWLR